MIKTFNKYLLVSYLGPFIVTFFISMFVLFMQFLWKYIEDLIGKGLDTGVIIELILYVNLTLVPLALPLTILLSSIMTFGNLGEHYELVALKSAGLSLRKIMGPLILVSVFLSMAAFVFSNNILPYANLKSQSLIYDIMHQKPSISIKEKAFYSDINKYVIRVEKKDKEGDGLHKIMIYDHSQGGGNTHVVIAESGNMKMSEDGKFFLVNLKTGSDYTEIVDNSGKKNFPLMRSKFDERSMRIPLIGFDLSRTDQNLFKSNYEMLNLKAISHQLDTVKSSKTQRLKSFNTYMDTRFFNKKTYYGYMGEAVPLADTAKIARSATDEQVKMYTVALNIAKSAKSEVERTLKEMESYDAQIRQLQIVKHKKFTLSFACIILFFIGAPLGAIIRKGGLGMPVVVSIVFFIFFWVISIIGEKFAKEGVVAPFVGMWFSSAIMLPIGIFLTLKATADSALFDLDAYKKVFSKLLKRNR